MACTILHFQKPWLPPGAILQRRWAMKAMKDFKEFLLQTNALALAIGVIIGGAIGKVVSSLVADILMPPLGLILGHVDLSNLFVNLGSGTYATLADAQKAGVPTVNYGLFL